MAIVVAAKTSGTSTRFTAEDIQHYKAEFSRTGYLVFNRVVPADILAALRDRILEAFEEAKTTGDLFAGGGLMSGHLNCFTGEESRFIYDACEARGILDLVRAIA